MSKVTIFTKYKSERKTRWAIAFGQNVNWKRKQVLIEIVRKKPYVILLCGFLSRSLSYLSCLRCNNYSIIAQVRIWYVAGH